MGIIRIYHPSIQDGKKSRKFYRVFYSYTGVRKFGSQEWISLSFTPRLKCELIAEPSLELKSFA